MIDPLDLSAYIIELSKQIGEPLTNMKLQKLIYYSFVWYAVEKGQPLFKEPIVAWQYGPVVVSVYQTYKDYGADTIKEVKKGNASTLDAFTRSLVEEVFDVYGNKTAIDLMNLTHSEAPWRDTFNPDNQNTAIPLQKIIDFYKARKQTSES